MTKNKNIVDTLNVNIDGESYEVFRIKNDSNGNPRYVIHFIQFDIALEDYDKINTLYGFIKYRSKWFGGGIVFQSYNVESDLKYMIDKVNTVNKKRGEK